MDEFPHPRRRLRFSLRSLLLFVIACGCGTGLWQRRAPWTMDARISGTVQDISPDGREIITSGPDKIARVWDAHTGALLREFEAASKVPGTIRYSPDGTLVIMLEGREVEFVTGGWVQDTRLVVSLWDAKSGKRVRVLSTSGVCYHCEFSGDGRHIIVVKDSYDRHAFRLDGRRDLPFATEKLSFRGFSPDGLLAATVHGSQMELWDTKTMRRRHVLTSDQGFIDLHKSNGLNFSPDSRHLAIKLPDGKILIWNCATGREAEITELPETKGRFDFIHPPRWSADSSRLCIASSRGIHVIEVSTGRVLSRMGLSRTPWPGEEEFFPDSRRLAARNGSEEMVIFDEAGRVLSRTKLDSTYPTFEILPKGDAVLFTDTLRDPMSGDILFRFPDAAYWNLLGDAIVVYLGAVESGTGRSEIWRQRRPYGVWGLAVLPESWTLALALFTFVWSVQRDWKRLPAGTPSDN